MNNKYLLLMAVLASSVHAESFRYSYKLSADVPYDWASIDSTYTDWKNIGNPYGCSNWSPSPGSVGKGIGFEQTATDCKQDQTRSVQPRQQDSRTGKIENSGDAYSVSRTITIDQSRDSVGILENWSAYDPTYTDWTNTNALYGCTSWTPDPSIYKTTTNFTQSSSTCKTDQERQRQDREQEKYTSEIRNSGTPVTEDQTLTGQSAQRPYAVKLGDWTNVGGFYDCSNWSPDPGTVGKGVAFTQTATDCKMSQSRTRAESYADNQTGKTVNVDKANETQILSGQTNTQPAVGTREDWAATDSTYTAWTNVAGKVLYSCSNWSPAGSSKASSSTFTQTATDCSTDQTRTRQDREKEANTSEIRNAGTPVIESQTLSGQSASRSYTVAISAWANDGSVNSCSNWSPDPSTQTINSTFTQTATDCQQPQKRTRAESYIDHISGSKVAVSNVTQSQSITASSTRSATGTKETWAATTSVYSAWTNVSGKTLYSCSNWTPAGASKTASSTFTQTATNCSTDQTRTRQDREQEATTGAVRNSGAVVTEAQTLTGQTASRSYTVALGAWTNNGAVTSCSNWSPDPSTQTINAAFTQTATDCKQAQTRSRAESYVDHISGSAVAVSNTTEAQTITASSTRQATGTKETWVATSSTYSAWANTTAVYGCTTWSPSPSNYTVQTQFTQTGTGCSVDQSRTRQDRQAETTTGAVRNTGSPVTETQTVGGQTSSRSYLMDFGGWGDSGGYYNCTAYSPDASTVDSGTAFTQTATCNINQTRGAAGYTYNNGWVADPAVPYRTETQVIARAVSQTATGTKAVQVCRNDSSNYFTKTYVGKNQIEWINAYWDGTRIYYESSGTKYPSFTYGGYTFTTPDSVKGTNHYTICRN